MVVVWKVETKSLSILAADLIRVYDPKWSIYVTLWEAQCSPLVMPTCCTVFGSIIFLKSASKNGFSGHVCYVSVLPMEG